MSEVYNFSPSPLGPVFSSPCGRQTVSVLYHGTSVDGVESIMDNGLQHIFSDPSNHLGQVRELALLRMTGPITVNIRETT